MFAVIKTGGKQYKVAPRDLIEVATVAGSAGDVVTFDEVLRHGDENGTVLGGPLVAGAAVAGEIVGQKRTARILVFKKRRRQNSKRSRGHRQDFTLIRITEILTDGKKPSKAKKAEPTPVAKAPKAEAAAAPAAAEAPAEKPKPKRAAAKAPAAAAEEAAAKPARAPRKKAGTETTAKAKPAAKPRAKPKSKNK
jgi:large subunit ribosomal protein L21